MSAVETSAVVLSAQSLKYWRKNPIEFIQSVLCNPETGQPFELLPAERQFLEHALQIGPDGKLIFTEWLYSCPRKSGKTTFQAIVIIMTVLLYGGAFPEAYILANSLEQGKSRVFDICCRIIKASPLLRNEVNFTANKIFFPAFDALIQALPCDAGSAAGTNAVVAGFDELWSYDSEAARRLWDELTPPPTRKIAFRLTTTYAGFENEASLLLELYKRGLEQPKLGEDLYGGDGLLMFWSHKPIAHWQDAAWEARMRRERPSLFQRHFLNEFATSSTTFIDMSKWDDCCDDRLSPQPVNLFLDVWIGLDGSYKHDQTAIVAVTYDRKTGRIILVNHRAFQPTPEQPIDFEQMVEKTLKDWRRKYRVKKIFYDPQIMQAVAQRLTRDGLPMEEFPQTVTNLTAAGQCLYELIDGGNLLMYPNKELRKAVSHTAAKETPRGYRLTKQTSSHKIDLVAALSFACYGCLEAQKGPNFSLEEMLANEREPLPPPPNETPEQTKKREESERNAAWRRQQYFNHLLNPGPINANGMINWQALPHMDPCRR